MIQKEEAYKEIAKLVERFTEQYDSYKKADYNETLTRRDFIDPFFKALGWDIDNQNGYAEAYREVIHEDKVKVGKATKAPDYSFRLVGGKRLFFVEAKKPSVVVKDDIQPAYQVRRYGWSAKLPVSIITDFEEFAIYDCTKKPNPKDKASVARVKYITFKDYLAEFDFLWDTFSKEKVLKGSFDKFVQGNLNKKGTATVDKEFLQSLDSWRTYLATSISWNNKELNEDELNFVVQQTIDRLIFLRIAEDRGVEHYGTLQLAIKQGEFYQNLCQQFQQADDKYNSGLFDFKKDKISKTVKVDNKVLKTIINELYYPESPYEFSVLSVEILGSAYEQFLGKVIRIDKAHRAHIEEKPEVRKAGGVYYTPEYVVEYIVKNTVGKLIEGKQPKEVSKIKIVDPACGSGSFLIGAYQYLLDWHKNFYNNNAASPNTQGGKGKKDDVLTPEGNLTTAEKKRILLNNIYGVDIDVNAVEVTKLSLLLKCMEGETEASIATQTKLFNERVLPTLDFNIKDGNSLVDTDFYESELDFGEEKKIKPFNWQKGFPDVFKQGGFDCVIGNPPYVFGRDWKSLGIGDDMKSYLGHRYKSSPYQLDFFSIFMEKGVQLANDSGYSSFIVPNVWLTNTYSSSTRKFLLGNSAELKIAVPETKVFEGITVDTVIYILKKGKRNTKTFTVAKLAHSDESLISDLDFTEYASGEKPISTSLSKGGNTLIEKIKNNKTALGEIADITRGVHPYRVGGFGKSAFGKGEQIQRDVDERPYHSVKPKSGYRPFVYGKDLKCFTKVKPKEYISYGKWLAEPRDEKFFEGDRIYSRKILGETLIVTVEKENTIADQQVYITKPHDKSISVNYLSAILGSKLISFFIRNYFDEVNDAFPQIKVGQLKSLPIKIESEKNQAEVNKLVDQLIKLNEEKSTAKLATQVSQFESKIVYCEDKINQFVFQLYELTDAEIKIVTA
ncbi:MAG TPA: TaqI-like C-terminal specificity domain-containing protein [Bacteroidia bacterium]|nr:TaqI-like C-terminal specificity domain-containing protein [Bacteroidia bacterium]HQF27849.1 TaqI-like C-terminal specificity domain-containing protein [Bacteroidia bacterium]HQK97819.1 TaqI-like C-terminal specificity domain-containing protein [Bacteroidia bacterium]